MPTENELITFAINSIGTCKYFYKSQVDEDIPAYMQSYYPTVPMDELRKAARRAAEIVFSE